MSKHMIWRKQQFGSSTHKEPPIETDGKEICYANCFGCGRYGRPTKNPPKSTETLNSQLSCTTTTMKSCSCERRGKIKKTLIYTNEELVISQAVVPERPSRGTRGRERKK
jgi:hypothetical protein